MWKIVTYIDPPPRHLSQLISRALATSEMKIPSHNKFSILFILMLILLYCFVNSSALKQVAVGHLRPIKRSIRRVQSFHPHILKCVSEDKIESNEAIHPTSSETNEEAAVPNPRQISWTAASKATVRVNEIKRTAEEYMALPASQYSVLSADQVERLSDSEFKYKLGSLNFFGKNISPVLFVTVNVYPEQSKSEIVVSRAEISGSELAEKISGSFSVNAVNIVSSGVDAKGRKTLSSDSKLQVDVVVPPSPFPLKVIKSSGNFLMQSTLSVLVATFIRILAADFSRWSAGDDSRNALDGANLSA